MLSIIIFWSPNVFFLQKVCLGQYFLVNLKRTQNTLKLQRKMSSSNSRRLERKKTKKNSCQMQQSTCQAL
jgi:hypothetical protein